MKHWIDANKASYVIESVRHGGMGAAEVVPFGSDVDAQSFVALHSGRVVRLAEIPEHYVLGND